MRSGQDSERSSGQAGYRLGRLWAAADLRKVPLRTIIAAIVAVAFFFLAGKLIYRLRDVVLLMLVAGFLALILNPLVLVLQKYVVKRRGFAVTIVGVHRAAGVRRAGRRVRLPARQRDHAPGGQPADLRAATRSRARAGSGSSSQHYHVQQWVQQNAAKLVTFGQNLSKPALAVGKGALSLLIELLTIFILVLMLLLEGPRLRRGVLSLLSPRQAEEAQAIASEVNRSVIGYMLGNFLTSIICGLVVLVDLVALGVPFPLLWALWVALVDFLPMIGGALAGIPVVIFAAFQSLTAGIITLVVFLVYTQLENHILNPVIMSKTVRISPLLVLVSVLVAASLGDWIGGLFGGFVAALLAIPAAGAFQVIAREAWRLTAPPPADEAEAEAMVGGRRRGGRGRGRGRRGEELTSPRSRRCRRGRAGGQGQRSGAEDSGRSRSGSAGRTPAGATVPDARQRLAAPPAVVHEVLQVAPLRPQVALFRLGVVADRDRTDRLVVVRHPERGPEPRHRLRHDPEVHRAEPLVDRGLQDQQRRHPGVDVPERHRPPRLVPVGPALVRPARSGPGTTRLQDMGTMTSGAVCAEEAIAAPATAQNFSLSAASVSTRNACPCENPADGPRSALPRIRVSAACRDRLVGERPHHAPSAAPPLGTP